MTVFRGPIIQTSLSRISGRSWHFIRDKRLDTDFQTRLMAEASHLPGFMRRPEQRTRLTTVQEEPNVLDNSLVPPESDRRFDPVKLVQQILLQIPRTIISCALRQVKRFHQRLRNSGTLKKLILPDNYSEAPRREYTLNPMELRFTIPTRTSRRSITEYQRQRSGFISLVEPVQVSKHHPDFHPDAFLEEDHPSDKVDLVLHGPRPSKEESAAHAWNPNDTSVNIYVKVSYLLAMQYFFEEDDPRTLHRNPIAQSTDAARGMVGFSHGFHVWEIWWPRSQRGTHAVIGVCTKNAPLRTNGYMSLIGANKESFGWDIVRGVAVTSSRNVTPWPFPTLCEDDEEDSSVIEIPEVIYCILDMDMGYLAFASEDRYYGAAFRGLKGLTLYPAVSAVWGHCEVTINYMGSLWLPRSLKELGRRQIRSSFGPTRILRLYDCNLPSDIEDYLMFIVNFNNPFIDLDITIFKKSAVQAI